MARKENDLTACMITQALQGEYWKLDDNETKIIESNDVTQITNLVVKKLEDAGMVVVEAYGIIHDKGNVCWYRCALRHVHHYWRCNGSHAAAHIRPHDNRYEDAGD